MLQWWTALARCFSGTDDTRFSARWWPGPVKTSFASVCQTLNIFIQNDLFVRPPGEILWKSFSANSPDLWNCDSVAAVPSLQMKARATSKNRNVIQSAATFKCCERRGWAGALLRLDENAFLVRQRAICIYKWVCGCVAYLVPHLRKKQTTYSDLPVIYCLVIAVCLLDSWKLDEFKACRVRYHPLYQCFLTLCPLFTSFGKF